MTTSSCHQCKRPFERAATGRPRKFCSDRCRVTHGRRMKRLKQGVRVPTVLVEEPRWVRHVHKRPITAAGRAASVTDSKTWAPFADVVGVSKGHGLGFVLGGGIGCIDLDGVIDGDGALDPAAVALLEGLPATWVERSPSGNGLHVWGYLAEAPGTVRTVNGVSVEVYSQGRYMTVTGDLVGDAPLRLADLSEFVESLG